MTVSDSSFVCYELVSTPDGKAPVYVTKRLPAAPLSPSTEGFQRRLEQTVEAFFQLGQRCHVSLDYTMLFKTCRLIEQFQPECKSDNGQIPQYLSRSTDFKDSYQYEIAPDGHIYLRIKEIGRGEFKKIYLGIDYNNARLVAISEIPQVNGRGDTFIHEQVALERIQDQGVPGLLEVYGIYAAMLGHRLIISRFYCGGDLAARIKVGALHPADQFLATSDLLRGINFLHKIGILHRDIKPENVLLTIRSDGRIINVVLTDFGSSTPIDEGDRLPDCMTDLRHRPPELEAISLNRAVYGVENPTFLEAYDIWSLGLTLLRMYQKIGINQFPWEESVKQKNFEEVYQLKKKTIHWVDPNIGSPVYGAIKMMVHPEASERPSAESLISLLTS